MLHKNIRVYLISAESRHDQKAEAEDTSSDKLSEPETPLEQGPDHSNDAVQQPEPAKQVALALSVPTEQTTTSALKPAEQLSIINRPKRSISAMTPRYEDEFAPIQAKHFKASEEPSFSDYSVHRRGAILYVINHITGRRESASLLGSKWPILKHQFLEGKLTVHECIKV